MARRTSWAAENRRQEREAARMHRELLAEWKRQGEWAEKTRAAHEVKIFEAQRDCLVSMHKDCGPAWDWSEVARRPYPSPPQPPPADRTHAAFAHAALAAYQPSVFDRLLGADKKRIAELQHAVLLAQHKDADAAQALQSEYQQRCEYHAALQSVASGILGGHLEAYRAVLDHLSPFEELAELGMKVDVQTLRHDVAVLWCTVPDPSVIPRDEKKLSAAGKVMTKTLAAGAYWALYQDFVCGCAIRAARELFALLPVERVVVNAAIGVPDTRTGHDSLKTVLAVSFPRDVTLSLNYDRIDPSDSLANFSYRMKFKKTAGFEEVEPISAEDFFVTTASARR